MGGYVQVIVNVLFCFLRDFLYIWGVGGEVVIQNCFKMMDGMVVF